MIPDEAPTHAPIGHNQPADMRAAALAEIRAFLNDVEQDGKTFAQRRDEFLRSLKNAIVRDRDTVAACSDVLRMAREVRALIEEGRIKRSNPFRAVADALKGEADDFWLEVDTAAQALKVRIDAWTKEEDDRIAAQRAEQDAFFAAPAVEAIAVRPGANAPSSISRTPPPVLPARRAPIRGDLGGEVKAVDEKIFAISNFALLPDYILQSQTVTDAILKVAKAMSKHMGEIPGISVTSDTRNRFK